MDMLLMVWIALCAVAVMAWMLFVQSMRDKKRRHLEEMTCMDIDCSICRGWRSGR